MKTYRATIQFTAPVADGTVDATKMEAYIDVMAESEKHVRVQLAAMGVASEVIYDDTPVYEQGATYYITRPGEVSEDVTTVCIESIGP